MPEVVRFEANAGVARVTVDRPEALNALSTEVLDALEQAFLKARDASDVRALVVTGAGTKSFVAGADIKELQALEKPHAFQAYLRRGQGVFRLLERMGKPSIAAVNGYALGGGLELALACTLRIASEKARLGVPEINLGGIPGYGGTQRLARLVGAGRALELILTGKHVEAPEALRLGIVNEVVPADRVVQRAEALAGELASKSPVALKSALDAVQNGLEMPLDDALYFEAQVAALSFTSEDGREGLKAFLEKRPARWRGT